MNTSYKNKYLKYKQKYLKLKNQIGGSSNPNPDEATFNLSEIYYKCKKNYDRKQDWERFPKFTGEMNNNNIINLTEATQTFDQIKDTHDIYRCHKDHQKMRELADMKEMIELEKWIIKQEQKSLRIISVNDKTYKIKWDEEWGEIIIRNYKSRQGLVNNLIFPGAFGSPNKKELRELFPDYFNNFSEIIKKTKTGQGEIIESISITFQVILNELKTELESKESKESKESEQSKESEKSEQSKKSD